MKDDIKELYHIFLKIKEQGWIESKRKGSGGIGYTFESLLNKKEDSFPMPDFKTIEIKTMRKNSRGRLHLMHVTPDGDFLFPIKRVLDKLGYPCKANPEYRIFNVSVNTMNYTKVGFYKRIKLKVNCKEEKVDLIAESSSGRNLCVDVSWSFYLLKMYLESKFKYLAIIRADNKIINDKEYFRYSDIKFYELIDFERFVSLIECGIITISFCIDVFKSGKRIGQIHDHGTSFSINIDDVEKLFNNVEIENLDECIIKNKDKS